MDLRYSYSMATTFADIAYAWNPSNNAVFSTVKAGLFIASFADDY
jgi:hypothetical protein